MACQMRQEVAVHQYYISEFIAIQYLLWHATFDAAVGAFVMRGAGCIVNDLWDRDIDRLVGLTVCL